MSRATAWLYLRVSSQGQVGRAFSEEGYSIEEQRADCQRKAEQLEAEVTAEFIDPAETATNANRPKMKQMMERIRAGDAPTYVIVHKVDRFARNRRDDANMLFDIMESGAQLVSAKESIDGTPSGRLTHGILAAMAEYYSLNLSLEAKKGLYRKAKLGGTPGYAKIGYLNVGELVDGREIRTIAVDPERGSHLSWAFAAYKSGGYTLDTLERALAKRGLRTRPTRKHPAKPLSRTQLHRILRSKYYMGIVEYGGFEFPGRHDPLTDPETFEQVQQVLDAHNNAAERDRKHRHYLKGSLKCVCGERITFVKGKSKTGRVYDYFACLGRLKGTGCKLPYLPAHEVEQKVIDAFEQIAAQQLGEGTTERIWGLHLADVREAVQIAMAGMRKVNEHEVRRYRELIKTLNRKDEKLMELFYADALPADKLKREQEKIVGEQSAAEQGLREAEADVERVIETSGSVLDALLDLAATYRKADGLRRRFLNQAFFDCFRISLDGDVTGELREEIRLLTARDTPKRLRTEARAIISSGRGSNKGLLAEREGFEPSRELAPPTRLAGECLQPLGHLSTCALPALARL
jgi:site-specific DNA recombinase